MIKIFGIPISIGQIVAALPAIIYLLQQADALFKKLHLEGTEPDVALPQVLRILGQQLLLHFGLPHAMTPEEEKIWADRATKNVD